MVRVTFLVSLIYAGLFVSVASAARTVTGGTMRAYADESNPPETPYTTLPAGRSAFGSGSNGGSASIFENVYDSTSALLQIDMTIHASGNTTALCGGSGTINFFEDSVETVNTILSGSITDHGYHNVGVSLYDSSSNLLAQLFYSTPPWSNAITSHTVTLTPGQYSVVWNCSAAPSTGVGGESFTTLNIADTPEPTAAMWLAVTPLLVRRARRNKGVKRS